MSQNSILPAHRELMGKQRKLKREKLNKKKKKKKKIRKIKINKNDIKN